MSNKSLLLIILGISLATHFTFFGHPNQTVFDEVHFGKFISGYYTHEYYFDIHPPLGKLMIAGFAKLFNFQPKFNFANIGDKFPDNKYLALRFLPSLAGLLLPVVIFLIALQLKFTPRGAFMAGLFVALENALLVQTHYILMDGFLLLFGFLALLFYFQRKFIWMAMFGGLAVSIKWTGLTFLALPFFVEIFQIYKQRGFKQIFKLPVFFLIIPLVIYFTVFSLHFTLLTKPGPGDAFMKPAFRQDNVVTKFFQLNTEMYRSNQRLTATHPYGSQWYSWPFMARPIFYWVDGDARIYFLGNPIVWWASTVGVVLSIWYLVLSIKKKRVDKIVLLLLSAYVLNLLPFVGIKRVMFLYHYLTAMIFAVLMLTYIIEKTYNERRAKIILTGLALVSFASFLYFAPLTYGLNLSSTEYEKRVWLPGWK